MTIFLGLLIGVLSIIPLLASLKASKKVSKTSNFGYGALFMLGVFASFLINLIAILLCYFFAKDNIIEFVVPIAIVLIAFALVYGIYTVIKRNTAAKERAERNKKEKAE